MSLSSFLERIRALLMDSGGLIWDDAALVEALRLALGEYSLAGNAPVTLAGLDGASVTNLPELHAALIVWGAAAYAALARAVDRAEAFQTNSAAADLKSWGDQRLKEFKTTLAMLFPGYLAALTSGSAADPLKTAAEVALLNAQAQAASGAEARAAAAAQQAAADRAAEASRLAGLHSAAENPWGSWSETQANPYPEGYERS